MTEPLELPEHELVPQVISEIVELEPRCKAVACVMILDDDSAHIRIAFKDGTIITLLGAVQLLMSDTQAHVPRDHQCCHKPGDRK